MRPAPFLVDLTNYGLVEQLFYAWRERPSLLPRNGVALLWQPPSSIAPGVDGSK